MTDERAIEVLEIMKSQMNYFGSTVRCDGVKEMQEQAVESALKALSEIQQYRSIGTVEECRAAVEKQRAKKAVKDEYNHDCCPNCGWIVYQEEWGGRYLPHCENCGQAIDWEEDIP